jgi:hypothetical protein
MDLISTVTRLDDLGTGVRFAAGAEIFLISKEFKLPIESSMHRDLELIPWG